MPQFSIIIPVYRVEEYLEKCVDSILAQTCQDFELLLIDDGSPDGSGAICDRYAASHPNQVRALHQPNGGAGAARNRGIELAQGDYLLFVDGDDWLAPNLLEDLSASIAATPADLYLFGALVERDGKVTGELLGNYYHHKYGVDTRSVRFPGIISNVTLPGGGTTDYAVEIYYEAIRSGRFTCPVPADVYMDMIYMPDALRACVELMEADPSKLVHRNSFNIASMSFTPEIICAEIRKRMPAFEMTYDIDPVKREIAESWPNSLDDTCAREEWGWKPEWDLSRMTDDMLAHIRTKLAK